MRPQDRITPTLIALTRAWGQHPDWRLGQLVRNATLRAGHTNPALIEDDQLLEALHRIADET